MDPKRFYFETSSVNYLFDNTFNTDEFSSIKTKKLQLQKGRKWQISNITLWEIFLTKDEERRHNLFDFARCLFYDYLISSPEEIIINYLESGCSRIETQYELASNSLFSKEWTKACRDHNWYFEPDKEQIAFRTDHFRFIGEHFVKTKKGYAIKSHKELETASSKIDGAFLKYIYEELLKTFDTPTEVDKEYIGIAIQITMMILCYGIGFDQNAIEKFWNRDKETKPLERLGITLRQYPNVFFRGPIANISKMILLQSQNKTGRGLYFDALHSIYVTYSDICVTSDHHFLKFKNNNPNDPNMEKIVSPQDIGF